MVALTEPLWLQVGPWSWLGSPQAGTGWPLGLQLDQHVPSPRAPPALRVTAEGKASRSKLCWNFPSLCCAHWLQPGRIVNPLSKAGDRTCILVETMLDP